MKATVSAAAAALSGEATVPVTERTISVAFKYKRSGTFAERTHVRQCAINLLGSAPRLKF